MRVVTFYMSIGWCNWPAEALGNSNSFIHCKVRILFPTYKLLLYGGSSHGGTKDTLDFLFILPLIFTTWHDLIRQRHQLVKSTRAFDALYSCSYYRNDYSWRITIF